MSVNYTAPPTCAAFMQSDAFVRVIMGPVGSGKTTACIMEILRRGIEQAKGPDGFRRTRWAIVRTTLSQLRMTVLPDMLAWFRSFATYKVSDQLITLQFNDVVIECFLIPLEEEEDQKRLLSMQLTGCMVNECIELNPDLISAIAGRCGRYPSRADGGPTWHGIIADTNTPVIGSEWWKLMEEERPYDWVIFHQPSGLSVDAENVENLPPGYYERLSQNPNPAWVQRYVLSEYGEDPSGTAVFKDSFRRAFHVRFASRAGLLAGETAIPEDALTPVVTRMLLIGQDFGRAPCALICQGDSLGRLLVLEEVVAVDMGLETAVSRKLKPVLYSGRYAGMQFACVGDPSGVAKGTMLEEDHFDVLRRLGIPAFPAPTNDIDARIAAVENLLYQQRDGGPALVIDGDRCPMLVRALNGAYRFGKTKDGNPKPLPEKERPYADLVDCLQYVCLALNSGLTHVIAKRIKPKERRRPKERMTAAGWT